MTAYQHKPFCKVGSHGDAIKRLTDTYNLHRIAGGHNAIGKWFAASLAEGRTDNTLYDSKRDCVIHQKHNEKYYTFIKIIPASMTQCEAEVMMTVARRAYDAGMRLTDPDDKNGGKELIKRSSIEDMLALSDLRVTNVNMPGRFN